ncbi:MAG: thiamine pyrophosphate-binding protein, partial [Alphaproteobacteria bacterium]|nr:thiamine pyrophosphate-binding protein [Alphaproteobacteria bacterium]
MKTREFEGGGAGIRTVPVYQALAEDIKAMGVDTVFGLMSDDTAAFAVTLDAMGIGLIGARHENVAIGMADGYAAATGRLGVVCVGRGPALANGLQAASFAARTGNPVLIIYGEAALPAGPANALGPDYKALDGPGVLKAAGVRVFVPTGAATARATLADAAALARTGQAVALLLPVDVQHAEIAVEPGEAAPEPLDAGPVPARPALPARAHAVAAAASLLDGAKRPLILAGHGAWRSGARDALVRLAEKTGAMLSTTARGKDMFRGHPLNLGIIGSFSHSAARRMAGESDCV